jgi:hypothetical protein
MAFLLIFRSDEREFIESEAFVKLTSVGVLDLHQNDIVGAAISGKFVFCDDEVLIELKSDLLAFAVSDFGCAACEFAVRLQGQFPEPLRIVDEAYSFDLELKRFCSADQLERAITSACS